MASNQAEFTRTLLRQAREAAMRPQLKNDCAKTRPVDDPYEYWACQDPDGAGWVWAVLKKWQADDDKPFARWFCMVYTPIVPQGEMGDVYVADIQANAEPVDAGTAKNLIYHLQRGKFS